MKKSSFKIGDKVIARRVRSYAYRDAVGHIIAFGDFGTLKVEFFEGPNLNPDYDLIASFFDFKFDLVNEKPFTDEEYGKIFI